MTAPCPGCSQEVDLGPEATVGDTYECEHCAGVLFRVARQNGRYLLQEIKRASCPSCNQFVTLADDAKAGDRVEHCGQRYRLLHEYGAYALETEDSSCAG